MDSACNGFPLPGGIVVSDPDVEVNMTCYKGGETVFNNHQMCDVTSKSNGIYSIVSEISFIDRKILDMLPGRPPQVTFSCDKTDSSCAFQFWVDQVESFYCGLDNCTSVATPGYNYNTTEYSCSKIQCKCVPGRFICGEDGSVGQLSSFLPSTTKPTILADIGDFLREEIKGPAKFSCKTGQGCRFEEPAMNDLIDQMFGDSYITLQCEGGECLHYSQVPGYVVCLLPLLVLMTLIVTSKRPKKPDNTLWVALSVASALFVVLLAFIGESFFI